MPWLLNDLVMCPSAFSQLRPGSHSWEEFRPEFLCEKHTSNFDFFVLLVKYFRDLYLDIYLEYLFVVLQYPGHDMIKSVISAQ